MCVRRASASIYAILCRINTDTTHLLFLCLWILCDEWCMKYYLRTDIYFDSKAFSLLSALWGALSEKNDEFITSGKPVSLAREHWQFSPVAVPSSFWLVKSNVFMNYCNVVCFMHWIFSVLSHYSAITKMYWKSALKTGWFSLHTMTTKALSLIYSFNCSETLTFWFYTVNTCITCVDFFLFCTLVHEIIPLIAHMWWIVLMDNEYRFSSLYCVTKKHLIWKTAAQSIGLWVL